jgi:hypothetical protein
VTFSRFSAGFISRYKRKIYVQLLWMKNAHISASEKIIFHQWKFSTLAVHFTFKKKLSFIAERGQLSVIFIALCYLKRKTKHDLTSIEDMLIFQRWISSTFRFNQGRIKIKALSK